MSFLLALFEDSAYTNLYPLVYSRPVFELKCGILSLKESTVSQLNDLDLSEYEELEQKIRENRGEIDRLSEDQRKINLKVGSLSNEIKAKNSEIDSISDECERQLILSEQKKNIIVTLSESWPRFDIEDAMKKIHDNRFSISPIRKYEGENYGGQLNIHEKTIQNALQVFNQIKIRGRSIDYSLFSQFNLNREKTDEDNIRCFRFGCDLYRQIDRISCPMTFWLITGKNFRI